MKQHVIEHLQLFLQEAPWHNVLVLSIESVMIANPDSVVASAGREFPLSAGAHTVGRFRAAVDGADANPKDGEQIMADDHSSELTQARANLVEQRRNAIADLAGPFEQTVFWRAVEMIISIQSAIEAIDRVREEERAATRP